MTEAGANTEENPFAGQGSVLLDIGGDVGALVVTTPEAMLGLEVDIRPLGTPHVPHDHAADHEHSHEHSHDGHSHGAADHLPHVAVVNRPADGELIPSLVYPDLVEGTYELLMKGTDVVEMTIEVSGGEVATADWPS